MRVAHIHSNSHILAGQETVLINMANELVKKGIDVIVVLPKDGILADVLKEHKIKVEFIPLARFRTKRPIPFIRCVFQLFNFVRREKIDILHTSGIYPNQYSVIAAKLSGIKCVPHVHTTGYKRDEIQDSLLRWSDKIITVSQGVQEVIKDACIPESKIQVVYNGIGPLLSGSKAADIRESLGISEQSKVIGQIGQVIDRKGVEYFIRMAKVLIEQKREVRFLLVGDDKYEPGYMDKMKALVKYLELEKYIIFTGFKENVRDFFSIMDVTVLCSLCEGLPMVLIEAAFMGKPRVASNISGCNEVVEDGMDGFLVPVKNYMALAEKAAFLLDNPEVAKTIVFRAKNRAQEMFSLNGQIEKIMEIYRQVVAAV